MVPICNHQFATFSLENSIKGPSGRCGLVGFSSKGPKCLQAFCRTYFKRNSFTIKLIIVIFISLIKILFLYFKQKAGDRSWRSVWVVIRGNSLYLFKDKKDAFSEVSTILDTFLLSYFIYFF